MPAVKMLHQQSASNSKPGPQRQVFVAGVEAGIHHGPFVSGHFLAGPGSFRARGSGAADIAHS
jgi:hypothetical protein